MKGVRLCSKGCGCRCPPNFKTCCRGCATTGRHDERCLGGAEEPEEEGVSRHPVQVLPGGLAADANPDVSLPCFDEVPSLLPPPRWSNRDVPPVKWGMRFSQFADFVKACSGTTCWEMAQGAKGYVNLYDLNMGLLVNWTRQTGCSIALRMNPGEPLAAELMVSHCWAESVEECGEALAEYRLFKSMSSERVLWFCAFSQYQAGDETGDMGPTVAEQLQHDPFGTVIRHVKHCLGMVVVHTSRAEIYSRLWCVYEIAEAVAIRSAVEIACSVKYINTGAGKLREMLEAKTEMASCKDQSDEELIREKVKSSLGWTALDRLIFSFRVGALQQLVKHHRTRLAPTLEQELRLVEDMVPKIQEKAPSRDEACLASAARGTVEEDASEDSRNILQRICSFFVQIFEPPRELQSAPAPEFGEVEPEEENEDSVLRERLAILKKLQAELEQQEQQ